MTSTLYYTTQDKVRSYESVVGVFNELFKELKDLGKKKPDSTLNTAKVTIINRVLSDVIDCLEGEVSAKYLDLLDDDALPQYSDAILILSQHEGALKSFKGHHHGYYNGTHQWVIKEK